MTPNGAMGVLLKSTELRRADHADMLAEADRSKMSVISIWSKKSDHSSMGQSSNLSECWKPCKTVRYSEIFGLLDPDLVTSVVVNSSTYIKADITMLTP